LILRGKSSDSGANRAGSPPMIAIASGRPSAPACEVEAGNVERASFGVGSAGGRGLRAHCPAPTFKTFGFRRPKMRRGK
jgi:hypothetical protein